MAQPKVGTGILLKSLDPPEKAGFMTKQGGSIKTWKRRWFVLKGNALYYFKSTAPDTEAKGQVDLSDKTILRKEEKHGKKHAFAVYTAKRVFFMYPDSPQETDSWMQCISKCVERMKAAASRGGMSAPNAGAGAASSAGSLSPGAGMSGKSARDQLTAAKNEVYFLREDDSKVLEFWQIWSDSIPPREELIGPGAIDFEVAVSADMQKLTWRTAGPQNIFIQKMVDFFWNVGAPESEIDRLNDIGALVNPVQIGSWIDMSAKGGMDGGWYFPCDIALKYAGEASDPGEPTRKFQEWADSRGVTNCLMLGRDMGAAPPRQTEIRAALPGVGFEEQLGHALSAYQAFGFPPLPDEVLAVIRSSPKLGLRLSVVTSSEGFVRLGLLIPDPDAATVDRLCPLSGAPSSEPLKTFARALGTPQPAFVEFQYLSRGFGYGVYREGLDVVFHYAASS